MDRCCTCGTLKSTIWHCNKRWETQCHECYQKEEDARDMRTLEQLQDCDTVKTLNPEQVVKNFISCIAEYKKKPTAQLYDAMRLLFNWAGHSDRTTAVTISSICRWQNFNWFEEHWRWNKQ